MAEEPRVMMDKALLDRLITHLGQLTFQAIAAAYTSEKAASAQAAPAQSGPASASDDDMAIIEDTHR